MDHVVAEQRFAKAMQSMSEHKDFPVVAVWLAAALITSLVWALFSG